MKALKVLLVIALLSVNCMYGQNDQNKLAKVSLNYSKYGLKAGSIPEKWEDGMRTNGEGGTYEWWYFDAHLEDGSTAVIVFFTKPVMDIKKGLTPFVTIDIDRPDGTKIQKKYYGKAGSFSGSKDSCNVVIGHNYFRGNLEKYEIHFEDDELNIDVNVQRTTESWRPQTGQMVFGKDEADYFAWVVAVPQGKTNIDYTYKGNNVNLNGSCYHDHNWGNQSIANLFNHWYWARAEIGPYNVVASEMISEKKFNKDNIVVFNVSKEGKTIVDDGAKVKMYQTYGKMHPALHKDVSNDLVFIYDSPSDGCRYEVYFFNEKNIIEQDLLSMSITDKFKLRVARMISGFDGAYFRMTGKAEIRVFKNNQLIETYTSPKAVWELMYPGKPNQK